MRLAIHPIAVALVAALVSLVPAGPMFRQARAATPEEIEHSLQRAREFLYAKQNEKGNWDRVEAQRAGTPAAPQEQQWSGLTALTTYALLASGESALDSRIAKAVDFLKKTRTTGVYALGLRANVWNTLAASDAYKQNIQQDARQLTRGLGDKGHADGMFHYQADKKAASYDHSVSQFGVLGLWALSQAGQETETSIWKRIDAGWRNHQKPDGSWGYRKEMPSTVTMTAAGVASLFITQEFLQTGAQTNGNIHDEHIEAGLKWVSEHFQEVFEARNPLYTLYAIERIGAASGHKYFGSLDWYQAGADWLIRRQQADGSWPKDSIMADVPGTGFAALFLARGRAPVLMNKLEYVLENNKEGNWNQRPRDVAYLARWVGRQIERDLNWQIVPLDAPIRDLHDAPILYLAGDQSLNFPAGHEQKLKQFMEQGGLILGNADGSNARFAESFERLGQRLFPQYAFRALPETHPILTRQQFPAARWKQKPPLMGLSNGVRELMLLFPRGDPARDWQTREFLRNEASFELAANIFLYAVDKQNLRTKGQSHLVALDASIPSQRVIRVARLEHGGNWNPEPGGWRRLSAVMNNEHGLALDVQSIRPESDALAGRFDMAHLTGTEAFVLDEAARRAIAAFVEGGGLLLIDAAGGAQAFNESARREIEAIFPEQAGQILQTMLADQDPVYADVDMDTLGYRRFSRTVLSATETQSPRLSGARFDGDRLGVIYSAQDLSGGLVGQAVDGIVGYDPQTATQIVGSILLYVDRLNNDAEALPTVP